MLLADASKQDIIFGMPKPQADHEILKMALIGYEAEREKINEKMSEIRTLLDGRSTKTTAVEESAPVRKRHRMSATARKRIGDATRARWAALRAAKATATKQTSRKRPKLSAAE